MDAGAEGFGSKDDSGIDSLTLKFCDTGFGAAAIKLDSD